MMVFKKKKFLIIILLLITGCTSYTQLSSDVRIVKHKLFNDKENIYLEKFDKKTNIWLKAKCNNSNYSKNIENCANNTEFIGVSKMKIENLLSKDNDNNTNNQNSNSNDPGETSKENEDDNSEDDEEEEEEEEEDEEWDENDPGE